jgi:hypothetical protein
VVVSPGEIWPYPNCCVFTAGCTPWVRRAIALGAVRVAGAQGVLRARQGRGTDAILILEQVSAGASREELLSTHRM